MLCSSVTIGVLTLTSGTPVRGQWTLPLTIEEHAQELQPTTGNNISLVSPHRQPHGQPHRKLQYSNTNSMIMSLLCF